jgi:hypothetical protein
MKPRNVLFSLIFVIALLAYLFIKVRFWEPHKKLTFNRNPSRIEYSQFALCRMDCHNISANIIVGVFRNGQINKAKSDLHKQPCPIFTIHGLTKLGKSVWVIVQQCGTVARIIDCYYSSDANPCNCIDVNAQPVS